MKIHKDIFVFVHIQAHKNTQTVRALHTNYNKTKQFNKEMQNVNCNFQMLIEKQTFTYVLS